MDTVSGSPPDAAPLDTKPDFNRTARAVLQFLNDKTGKNFQPVAANLRLIMARLREGATESDLRAVIARKCREWKDDAKMWSYTRPGTLFNAEKFAQYRGELDVRNP